MTHKYKPKIIYFLFLKNVTYNMNVDMSIKSYISKFS